MSNCKISKICSRIDLLGLLYCLVFGPFAPVLLWFVLLPFAAAWIFAPYAGYVLLAALFFNRD